MVVLVTNNHLLETLEEAQKASYTFGNHHDRDKLPKPIKGEILIPSDQFFFFTHKVSI